MQKKVKTFILGDAQTEIRFSDNQCGRISVKKFKRSYIKTRLTVVPLNLSVGVDPQTGLTLWPSDRCLPYLYAALWDSLSCLASSIAAWQLLASSAPCERNACSSHVAIAPPSPPPLPLPSPLPSPSLFSCRGKMRWEMPLDWNFTTFTAKTYNSSQNWLPRYVSVHCWLLCPSLIEDF